MASLYILADTRKRSKQIEAGVLANYPFQIIQYDDGVLLIDLLKLTQTKIKYSNIPNIESFNKEINKVSTEPKEFLQLLKNKGQYFREFSDQNTINLQGLLSKPAEAQEILDLLNRTVQTDENYPPSLFSPILTHTQVKDTIDSLDQLKNKVKNDQKELKRAKKSLEDTYDITKKVLKEEIQNIKDSSAKVQSHLRESIDKKHTRLKKGLDRNLTRLRTSYQRQTRPLREERTKRKRRLSRAQKRVERLKGQGSSSILRDERKRFDELEKSFEEIDRAVKSLDAKKESEINKLKEQYNSEIKIGKGQINAEKEESATQVREKLEQDASIGKTVRGITKQIDSLLRKKNNDLKSLDRLTIDVNVKNIEINIPFYIFQYDRKHFDFNPPVEVVGSPGIFSRFRRMLADNLESKLTMIIKPQESFTNGYLERAVKALGKNTQLYQMYKSNVTSKNMFKNRSAMDNMMIGLVKMRRQGWIRDGEYIRLQEVLVDKLENISEF
jgi:hypothetical protein